MSTTTKRSVHERMIAILGELPAIGKNQRNQQQGFSFRGIDDVLNALNPLLARHGVYVVPEVLERRDETRETRSKSALYVVLLHVKYTFFGADGDSVSASGWGEGTDSGDKATNKAMTAALKYVLTQAFAISSAETVDGDAENPEESKRSRAPRPACESTPSDARARFEAAGRAVFTTRDEFFAWVKDERARREWADGSLTDEQLDALTEALSAAQAPWE